MAPPPLVEENVNRTTRQTSIAVDQLDFARAFGFRMVAAWWRALTANDHNRQPLREFFPAIKLPEIGVSEAKLAESKGEVLAELGADIAAHQIGLAYTSMLPPEHRATHGVYYTPPSLVSRLIDQATLTGVDWTRARVLDPACGGGAFLAPVA